MHIGNASFTKYLVDTNNLTGYAQVVEGIVGISVVRQYTYGSDLIGILEQTSLKGWQYCALVSRA